MRFNGLPWITKMSIRGQISPQISTNRPEKTPLEWYFFLHFLRWHKFYHDQRMLAVKNHHTSMFVSRVFVHCPVVSRNRVSEEFDAPQQSHTESTQNKFLWFSDSRIRIPRDLCFKILLWIEVLQGLHFKHHKKLPKMSHLHSSNENFSEPFFEARP